MSAHSQRLSFDNGDHLELSERALDEHENLLGLGYKFIS